jgi:hypothetical protein
MRPWESLRVSILGLRRGEIGVPPGQKVMHKERTGLTSKRVSPKTTLVTGITFL